MHFDDDHYVINILTIFEKQLAYIFRKWRKEVKLRRVIPHLWFCAHSYRHFAWQGP